MPDPKSQVEFSAKVERTDYDEFRELFPQYGAVTWFINASLKALLQKCRENREYRLIVELAIARMLEDADNATLGVAK